MVRWACLYDSDISRSGVWHLHNCYVIESKHCVKYSDQRVPGVMKSLYQFSMFTPSILSLLVWMPNKERKYTRQKLFVVHLYLNIYTLESMMRYEKHLGVPWCWFKLQESSFSFLQLLPLQERSSKTDNGSAMDRDLAVEVVPAVAAAAAGVMAVDLDLARDFMAPTMASELMALHMVLLTALHMGLPTAPDC